MDNDVSLVEKIDTGLLDQMTNFDLAGERD